MPIRDHFRPPTAYSLPWPSLFNGLLCELTGMLNERMPAEFTALDHFEPDGGFAVELATGHAEPIGHQGTSPHVFPDRFEVVVSRPIRRAASRRRDRTRQPRKQRLGSVTAQAFVSKVVTYLHEGVCVVIVDVVTGQWANLHNEIARIMRIPEQLILPPDPPLYAASYRPVIRDDKPQLDSWAEAFDIGDPLPTMPLRLIADYFVPIELEATYTETCRRRRLIP